MPGSTPQTQFLVSRVILARVFLNQSGLGFSALCFPGLLLQETTLTVFFCATRLLATTCMPPGHIQDVAPQTKKGKLCHSAFLRHCFVARLKHALVHQDSPVKSGRALFNCSDNFALKQFELKNPCEKARGGRRFRRFRSSNLVLAAG